jgi:hypothetical protein
MYLARENIRSQTHYSIRETYRDGDCLKSRDLFRLGTDPSKYIIYPGGKGYYFDEVVENTLVKHGLNPSQDELDNIFWEFLDPEIQRVIHGFEQQTKTPEPGSYANRQEYHPFDRRRIHFLRFGSMDQQQIHRLPDKFFRSLMGKSRDELEQYFMKEERILRPGELIRYLFAIFDLKEHLLHFRPDQTAGGLSLERVDNLFMDAVCALNNDDIFWAGMTMRDDLQEYLRRYLIAYFDQAVQRAAPMPRYAHEFINRHRTYQPPKKVRLNMAEASRLFETTWKHLRQMDSSTFTKLYRKQALKHHPDQGGSQEVFVKLTKLYEKLLKKKDRK